MSRTSVGLVARTDPAWPGLGKQARRLAEARRVYLKASMAAHQQQRSLAGALDKLCDIWTTCPVNQPGRVVAPVHDWRRTPTQELLHPPLDGMARITERDQLGKPRHEVVLH